MENRLFYPSHQYLMPPLGRTLLKFHQDRWRQKTRVPRVPSSVDFLMIGWVLTQYQRVTDGRTNRQNCNISIVLCMAVLCWCAILIKDPQGGWRSSPPARTASCGVPAITIKIFGNLEAPWPWSWPWIGSRSYWCAYLVEVYPHQIRSKSEKNFLWTYRRTDTRVPIY